MKVTEDQMKRIECLVKNREGLQFIMKAMMEPAQRNMFAFYDRECDVLALIERLNANNVDIGVDINSKSGMKYVSESIKFFKELYDIIMKEREKLKHGNKTLADISNAIDLNKNRKIK